MTFHTNLWPSREGSGSGDGEGEWGAAGDGVNHGVIIMTVDMRGKGIHGLEPNLFGNASWTVVTRMPASNVDIGGGGGGGGDGSGGGGSNDKATTGAMARAVRASVNAWRSAAKHEEGRGSMIALASADTDTQLKAAVSAVVRTGI